MQRTNKKRVSPLNVKVAIVNPDGTPTDEFMQKWEEQKAINATAENVADAEITPGTGLKGGGKLSGGDVSVGIADQPVTPGTYGDGDNVAQVTVNQQGQVTAVKNVAINDGVFPRSIFAPLPLEELDITLSPDVLLQMQLTEQF